MARQPNSGLARLVYLTLIYDTHLDTPSSAGLLWTSDHLDAGAALYKIQTQETNIHAVSGIQTRYLRNQRLQTCASDCMDIGIGVLVCYKVINCNLLIKNAKYEYVEFIK